MSEPGAGGGPGEPGAGARLEDLLGALERTLAELEASDDSAAAVDRLTAMAELARDVQAEIERLRREGDPADPPA